MPARHSPSCLILTCALGVFTVHLYDKAVRGTPSLPECVVLHKLVVPVLTGFFPSMPFFAESRSTTKIFWLFSCQRPDRSAGWDLFDVVVIRLLSFLHHHLRCRRRGHLIERLEKNAGGCVLLARGPRRGVELCLSPASHLLVDKGLNMDRHLTKLHLVPTRNGPLYSAVQPLNSARSAHSGNHPVQVYRLAQRSLSRRTLLKNCL